MMNDLKINDKVRMNETLNPVEKGTVGFISSIDHDAVYPVYVRFDGQSLPFPLKANEITKV